MPTIAALSSTQRPALSHYGDLLRAYLVPQGRRVAILTALLLGSIVMQLVNPTILSSFIDTAMSRGAPSTLTHIAIVFIAVAILQQLCAVAATYFSERVGWTATNALRADLTLHCLRLDLAFHKARTPGELIERLDGDVTALATFFSQFVIQVLGSILLLGGVLIILWKVTWQAGLVLTVFTAIVLALMLRVRAVATPYWEKDRQTNAELFGFLEERLAGTVDIRSSGAEAYVMRRLYSFMRARKNVASKANIMGAITWSVPVSAYGVGNVLAFLLAAWLFKTSSLSVGTAFLIYYYTQLLFHPLNLITNQMDNFQKASAGMVRIRELMNTHSTLLDGPSADFPVGALSVEFDGVEFGYGDAEMVISDLSFRLEPGKVLGVLGRTGSGKTTLTRLLFRLYDPAEGSIHLGGVNVRHARRADVRRRIGMVTQDVQLFHATVRDNLTFFDETIDDERIMAALNTLGLFDWLRGLPRGLDTELSAGGGGLSAGEAQLLAFTRVFLKDPGVVVLDEASSRLDPATERLIEKAVDGLLHGRTGIIIAHRLTTIDRADDILILDGGQIREYGPRRQLAADPSSRLAQLLRTGMEEVLV